MDKRYQVFVSSTFEDLKDERAKVMETILNNDCFPAGMEMFPAMDEEQFEYIKRIIDDSDYYLLIIGGRYGSVDDNGVSWTEKEFDYAVSKGIHVMAFVLEDEAYNKLPKYKLDKKDIELNQERLKKFKEKVGKKRLIRKWSDANTLALEVTNSLQRVLKIHPQIGWVRADKVASGDAQKEIDRLQKEIAKYQKEHKELQKLKVGLKKKDDECHSLEISNQDAQKKEIKSLQETIKNLQEKIDSLEEELKTYKSFFKFNKEMSQVEKITIPGTDVSFKMVRVEGGTFMMGANKGNVEARDDEKPAHQVTLSDYWIGETQVTQELWEALMGDNPSLFTVDPNCPVENVSWDDCKAFISKLNKLTGKEFRLPTEAEWEFAARGGNKSKDYIYAGSNDIYDVAWYKDNSGKKTNPVGKLAPNELGLYDMSGNVWEWCQDMIKDYSITQAKLKESKTDVEYVIRGGAWFSPAINCRVSFRYSFKPSYTDTDLGLRLAHSSTSINNTVN